MQAQLDAQTVSDKLARKFDVLDTRPVNGAQRVYVASLPLSVATVERWAEACGCDVARYGWDGVGGKYVDVRGVV